MANELLEKLVTAKENAASLQRDMLIYVKQEKLWDKLIEVQRHNYISNFMNLAMQQEQFDSDKELVEGTLSSKDEDQDEEVDFVLAEICSSSSEEEEGVMRTIMTIPLALLPVQDQGGEQHAFCYELHKVKDRSHLIIPVISYSMGKVITFLGHTRGS